MPNSQKPSDFDDNDLSFEEKIAKRKNRLAEAPTYSHRLDDELSVGNTTDYRKSQFSIHQDNGQKRDFSNLKRTRPLAADTDNVLSPSELSDTAFEMDFSDELLTIKQDVDNKKGIDNQQSAFADHATTPPPQTDSPQSNTLQTDAPLSVTPSDTPAPDSATNTHQKTDDNTPAYIKIDPKANQKQKKDNKTSKRITLTDKKINAKQAGMIMLATLLCVTWLKQDRLADYWQQTYQTGEPWATLAQMGIWQSGEKAGNALNIDGVNGGLASVGVAGNNALNQAFFAEQLAKQPSQPTKTANPQKNTPAVSPADKADNTLDDTPNAQPNNIATQDTQITPATTQPSTPLTHISLSAGQKVLFAGDSMMQGVAPWVMRKLKSDYQIDSTDLSKQSTGLSYSSFFDWPATIEKTLAEQSNIKALIIYLGANDPWAVPNPANKAAKYIDFATDEWVVLYHQKMQRILDNAKSHGVQVIWITPPTMKKPKLNEQMKVLTEIMHKGIDKTQVVVIDSKPLLSPSDDYTDSIIIGEKTVKVRTADGIHFTTDGQKHLANHILMHIQVAPQ